MSIQGVLRHRATVERAQTTMVAGQPVKSWSVVLTRCPVLYSKDPTPDLDPTWTAIQRREADQRGTLFALPSADILPGDRIRITRPALPGAYEVQPDPSTVLTLHGISHKELKVRSVS